MDNQLASFEARIEALNDAALTIHSVIPTIDWFDSNEGPSIAPEIGEKLLPTEKVAKPQTNANFGLLSTSSG